MRDNRSVPPPTVAPGPRLPGCAHRSGPLSAAFGFVEHTPNRPDSCYYPNTRSTAWPDPIRGPKQGHEAVFGGKQQ